MRRKEERMELKSENVETIFMKCLFNEGEDTENRIEVEGIVGSFGFHPERVAQHKDDIFDMLNQLPDKFKESSGGGWTFLNACENSRGEQWTGLHQTMEQLVCLGIAIEKVKFIMPRNLWSMFPGSMPYFIIKG